MVLKRINFTKDRFIKLLPLKDRRRQTAIRQDILKDIKDLDKV